MRAIEANLRDQGVLGGPGAGPARLAALWPGSGFNAVAAGGSFAVLTALEGRGVLSLARVLPFSIFFAC